MDRHDCLILRNKFGKRYFCHLCGAEYGEVKKIQEELLLDIYNLIIDENEPMVTSEGILVFVKEKLKGLGGP